MAYSDLYFRSKNRFSVALAAVAAVSILSFSLFFMGTGSAPTQASKKVLKRHEIVNLSSTQAGIFWQSEKKEVGWIVYSDKESNMDTVVFDERDLENKKTSSYYHYVLLRNLDRDKVYYYKVVSGNEAVAKKDKSPFSFKTAKNVNVSSSVKPAYGKVLQPNGMPALNVFVAFYYPNAVPLVALTKTTGEWLIPLQFTISRGAGEIISINDQEKIRIEMLGDDLPSTNIESLVKKTNPLSQTIIMGKDYKFISDEEVLPASTTRFPQISSEIDIIFPREGAVVPAVKPLLKGTALPNKEVNLTINSRPAFTKNITADKEGQWKIELPIAIASGSYTLVATTDDEKGKKMTLKRNFSIAKSGEQVLGDATGGATTTTPVPTGVSPLPTATPEVQAYVTADPSVLTPTPPVSGLDSNIFMYSSMALIIMGAGFLLVF